MARLDPADLAELMEQWESESALDGVPRLDLLAERAIAWVQAELATMEQAAEEERARAHAGMDDPPPRFTDPGVPF